MKTYSIKEAADYMGRDVYSIERYHRAGKFPEPIRQEKRKYCGVVSVWTAEQLDAWNPNDYVKILPPGYADGSITPNVVRPKKKGRPSD